MLTDEADVARPRRTELVRTELEKRATSMDPGFSRDGYPDPEMVAELSACDSPQRIHPDTVRCDREYAASPGSASKCLRCKKATMTTGVQLESGRRIARENDLPSALLGRRIL